MNLIMVIIAIIAGVVVGIQAGVNGNLGSKIGVIEGAFMSFFTGTLALLLVVFFFGKGNLLSLFTVPKWQLTGGLLGAVYVIVAVLAVPKIGVASTLVAVIAGQILSSTVIDHFGLLGGRHIPIDWQRVVAIVLMATALILFYRK